MKKEYSFFVPDFFSKNFPYDMNIGDKAPEILGINEKGEEIRLSNYAGKKSYSIFTLKT